MNATTTTPQPHKPIVAMNSRERYEFASELQLAAYRKMCEIYACHTTAPGGYAALRRAELIYRRACRVLGWAAEIHFGKVKV